MKGGGRKPAGKMGLNHLHLHVKNLDRAKRFYESYFGFRERVRHGDPVPAKYERLRSGSPPDRKPSPLPDWFPFGFRLASVRAVRELHVLMTSEG